VKGSAPPTAAGFALIHSPMVGPDCWRAVASCLRRDGFDALAIEYGGVRGPDWYDGAATRIARQAADLNHPWVLALHSAAGAMAPAIVGAAITKPSAILFVDAILPHPARSWLETAPPALANRLGGLAKDGVLPPWNRWFVADPAPRLISDQARRVEFESALPRLTISFLQCPAPAEDLIADETVGYLRLSEGYEAEASAAELMGWKVASAPMDHLAMISQPDRVAAMMVELAAALLAHG
jgi:hypothetical protein